MYHTNCIFCARRWLRCRIRLRLLYIVGPRGGGMTEQIKKGLETSSKREKRGRPRSGTADFPKVALVDTIKLAQSIEDNNAGRPFDRLTLAKSLNYSPNGITFRDLITTSSRYGITKGSYTADKIELTPLGRTIVTAQSDRKEAMQSALLHPELYKKFFEYYDKKKIPQENIMKTTLKQEFNVDPTYVDKCYKIIIKKYPRSRTSRRN